MTAAPAPHRLNTGFDWPDRPAEGLKALTPDQIAHWNAHGFLKAEGLWPAATISALTALIDPIEAELGDTVLTMEEQDELRYPKTELSFARGLVARLPALRAFALSPLFADLMQDLIGPAVRLYWDQAVYKKPGAARDFPWHQDNGYGFVTPQAYVTCWLPLTHARRDNGCPWLLPGWHRRGTLAHRHNECGLEIVGIEGTGDGRAVEARPGDAVIFSSLTPHRTGANRTRQTRKALILQYIPEGAALITKQGCLALNDPARHPPLPVAPA